jgi:hypothetical protein
MDQQQSAQQGKISVAEIISLGASFLQLPYEARCNAYRQVGVIFSEPISYWSGWHFPEQIPVELYASKEISADVESVYWFENMFSIYLASEIPDFLHLGTPIMWSSLRNLTIWLTPEYLPYWQEVCNHLGAYSPPSQLTLDFYIDLYGTPTQEHADTVRDALYSILALPVLKKLSFTITPAHFLGVEIDHMATNVVKGHSTKEGRVRQSVKQRSHVFSFRFMDLPVEIQLMILGYTDLVAPGPVTASMLKGYVLNECHKGDCEQGGPPCVGRYKPYGNSCWTLPANLLHVNRYISMMSEEVFFFCNQFIVDVRLASYPAPLINWSPTDERISGVWNPKHSNFLSAIPTRCIPILRSLTWHFPMCDEHVYSCPYLCPAELSERIKHDWICMINFIAENVRPLSRLTLTLDLTLFKSQLPDEIVLPVRKLHDLGGLFVRPPWHPDPQVCAAEALRLERLAMRRD